MEISAMENDAAIAQAIEWIRSADGLLITAGAGMGVDSGLPDFRGSEGFWRAYPALRDHGYSFQEMATPSGFERNPRLSWGFYGHRLALYRETTPHAGFDILLKWAAKMKHGAFVFTSNVDGQFQKAGFPVERIVECHGTIHMLQCLDGCTSVTWPADEFHPVVNEQTCELENDMPRCRYCARLARPNILMFNDGTWVDKDVERQERRFDVWRTSVENPVVIEMGAGRAISTVRRFSERHGPRVIRINPREYAIAPKIGVGLAGGALDVLKVLDEKLGAAM
jgi:NAD-dependent SIR2 family protein deacetylase